MKKVISLFTKEESLLDKKIIDVFDSYSLISIDNLLVAQRRGFGWYKELNRLVSLKEIDKFAERLNKELYIDYFLRYLEEP